MTETDGPLRLETWSDDLPEDQCCGWKRNEYGAKLSHSEGMERYYAFTSRSRQLVIRDVLTQAYLDGVREVLVDGRVRHLRSSPLRNKSLRDREETRLREAEEQKRREAEMAHRMRSHRVRLGKAKACVARLQERMTSLDVLAFFRAWRKVTGYGAGGDMIRQALAPGKALIIDYMVRLAETRGWCVGIRRDYTVWNNYSSVVYIDTPCGQASFHVRHDAYGHLPEYPGEWSRKHDTPEIVAAVVLQAFG